MKHLAATSTWPDESMASPQFKQRLEHGEFGMERAALLVSVVSADTESDLMARLAGHNLKQVARFAAHHKRLGRHRERLDHDQSYVVIQPSLDESWWRLNGGLTGPAGAAVEHALRQRSDQLPSDGTAAAHRQALALESLALDSLDGPLPDGTIPRAPAITAFVDWDLASATGGEAGAEIATGPRLGPDALEELWCEGSVRVITVADGQPVTTTPNTRTIPPAVRDYVLWRDGACRAPGCTSRHRLQPHHVIPAVAAVVTTPTTSSPCAGSTITSSSTAEVSPLNPATDRSDWSGPNEAEIRPEKPL